ncbi:MAG: hypothetical protein EOL91_05185 [Actinobacteria bacterium]|nr:hypothetical protein [Actinomycetota bacterium]
MLPRRNSARALVVAYVVVAVVAVVAEIFRSPLADVAGWLALPLLAELVLVSTDPPRPRPVVLVVAALALSFLADVAADLLAEPAAFVTLLGLLTLAQLCYVAAFRGLWRSSLLRTSPRWLIWYGLLYVVGVFAVRAGAGDWFWPLLAYGVLVAATAVLASALGLSAAFGGALFFVSASLAAMHRFTPGWDKPGLGFWIALTLLAAHGLITLGVVRRWQAEPAAPAALPIAGDVTIEAGAGPN